MTIGFQVGAVYAEIGAPSFAHSFFSTISYHLEPQGWGTRFPELMDELYHGSLKQRHAKKALADLRAIRRELKMFPPSAVVWDINDRRKKPPWGNNISDRITDLSNYFTTSDGRDVFTVTIKCLQALIKNGGVMRVV